MTDVLHFWLIGVMHSSSKNNSSNSSYVQELEEGKLEEEIKKEECEAARRCAHTRTHGHYVPSTTFRFLWQFASTRAPSGTARGKGGSAVLTP